MLRRSRFSVGFVLLLFRDSTMLVEYLEAAFRDRKQDQIQSKNPCSPSFDLRSKLQGGTEAQRRSERGVSGVC